MSDLERIDVLRGPQGTCMDATCFKQYAELAPGERVVIMCLATDRAHGRTLHARAAARVDPTRLRPRRPPASVGLRRPSETPPRTLACVSILRSLDDGLQEVVDDFWLTAVTPTFLPAPDELADHARSHVGLARAWRALHGQDAMVELEDQAARRCAQLLAFVAQGRTDGRLESGRPLQEEIACPSMRSIGVDAVLCDPGRQALRVYSSGSRTRSSDAVSSRRRRCGRVELLQARRRPRDRVSAGVHCHPQCGGRRGSRALGRRRLRVVRGLAQRPRAPLVRARSFQGGLHRADVRRGRKRSRVCGRDRGCRGHRGVRATRRGVPRGGPGPVRALRAGHDRLVHDVTKNRPDARPRARRLHRAVRLGQRGPDQRDADPAVYVRARPGAGRPRGRNAGLLRARAAQPAGPALRHAALARGLPRIALDRRALSPVRLLPRKRRGRGCGGDDD